MSASVIATNETKAGAAGLRTHYTSIARNYVLIALGLALFGAIYEHFSFGVYSYYMIYAFAVPLVLGALPALLFSCAKRPPYICGATRKLWRDGIAVLTVGSLFTGVIQIYGTDSGWSLVYGIIGVSLLLLACAVELLREGISTPFASGHPQD